MPTPTKKPTVDESSDEPNVLVRYVRNQDDTVATGALAWPDDDRPDLVIGQVGYVTEDELYQANAVGAILEPITEEEVFNLGLSLPQTNDDTDKLEAMSNHELRQIAADEGANIEGLRKNTALAKAIQENREAQPEGEESLPPSAKGTTSPAAGAQSTAAGSGPAGTTSTGTGSGS